MTPVVLIHGVGLDRTMWDMVRPLLSTDRPIITYDLLGHGDAPALADGSDITLLVEQLLDIVDGTVDLVGFSLGALIAQAFTLAHPRRVRRLVLLNGVFNRSQNERSAILDRVQDVRDGGYLANVATALDRWFSTDFAAANPTAWGTVAQRMAANDVGSYANAYEIFATADETLASQAVAITCPTLVVTSQDDPRSTPDMTRALAAAVTNGRAAVIPNARHLTPIETPGAVAALIEEFLGDHDA